MFTNFSKEGQKIVSPEDRRRFIGFNPYAAGFIIILLLLTVGLAWLQFIVFGLPADTSIKLPFLSLSDHRGFPIWVSISHWVNFFLLMLIIRSGLSILADPPPLLEQGLLNKLGISKIYTYKCFI